MNISIIIPAAGSSSRYNNDPSREGEEPRSKLDEDLAGRPVLQRTVELFNKRPEVGQILVAGPHEKEAFEAFCSRHADKLAILGVTIVRGGPTHRYQSVQAALAHISDDATHVAIHDAARPGTPDEMLDRVFAAAERHAAVVPVLEIADTVKRAEAFEVEQPADPLAAILDPKAGKAKSVRARRVQNTVDRTGLVLAQTPQVFTRGLITVAYTHPRLASTDDAGLVEQIDEPVFLVQGDLRGMKITTHQDFQLLRLMLNLKGPKERSSNHKF
ncbi:MAG: 2-C-methyl-D-erythritol 4-phosphate cytidylyltransferase [Phycisphaerales bacterium]|jgi:2-C-methyl-D-erythritol 4-phosphate cytidylyltransferase